MILIQKHKIYAISLFTTIATIAVFGIYFRAAAKNDIIDHITLNQHSVVIDAGHGGSDPGAVSRSGTKEKDINLAIAKKLQILLEKEGIHVILTRTNDDAIANTKAYDMYKRRLIAEESQADIFISIHQNSHTRKSVKGAQAFYYGDSEKGKILAKLIQEQFTTFLDKSNKHSAMANEKYYVLKKIPIPSVLVETGYLSNYNESRLLITEEYQQKIAQALYNGILNYFTKLNDIQN